MSLDVFSLFRLIKCRVNILLFLFCSWLSLQIFCSYTYFLVNGSTSYYNPILGIVELYDAAIINYILIIAIKFIFILQPNGLILFQIPETHSVYLVKQLFYFALLLYLLYFADTIFPNRRI